MGVTLLRRTSSGVSPTAAGQIFAEHCRDILRTFREVRKDMKHFSDGVRGELRIHAVKSAIGGTLPFDIKSFEINNPAISILLQERYSHECMQDLREDLTDLVIVSDAVDYCGFGCMTYREDPIWVVAAKNHPVFSHANDIGRIAFVDTLRYEIISLNEGGTLDELIETAAHRAGKSLSHRYRVARFDSLRRLAEAGLGIGLLRRSAVEPYMAHFPIDGAPLADTWAARSLVVVFPKTKDANPATGRFLQFLRDRES